MGDRQRAGSSALTTVAASMVVAASMLVACGGDLRDVAAAPDAMAPDAMATDAMATDGLAADGGPGTSTCPAATAPPPMTGATEVAGSVSAWTDGAQQLLFASFPHSFAPTAAGGATSCDCISGIGLPLPGGSAGTITVRAAPCGSLVATLPYADEAGSFPSYPGVPASWTPGEALFVWAPGVPGQAPAFAGTLSTPALIADLRPAFGPTARAPVIPLNRPFVVSWTPEGRPGETMDVSLSEILPTTLARCDCLALDSAGSLTVPPSFLQGHFMPTNDKMTATASATRTLAAAAGGGDAVVQLIGEATLHGTVTLE